MTPDASQAEAADDHRRTRKACADPKTRRHRAICCIVWASRGRDVVHKMDSAISATIASRNREEISRDLNRPPRRRPPPADSRHSISARTATACRTHAADRLVRGPEPWSRRLDALERRGRGSTRTRLPVQAIYKSTTRPASFAGAIDLAIVRAEHCRTSEPGRLDLPCRLVAPLHWWNGGKTCLTVGAGAVVRCHRSLWLRPRCQH